MSNKKLGNDFENRFINILSEKGFWCHLFVQNQAGQPADVIAVKHGYAHLIDCKVCSNDIFPLDRMEENQRMAMKHWHDCENGDGWFAIETSSGQIFMIDYGLLEQYRQERKSLNLSQIDSLGVPIERWLMMYE